MPVCQIIFFKLLTSSSEKYVDRVDAKYAKEIGPQNSKIYQEMKFDEQKNSPVKRGHLRTVFTKYFLPFFPELIMLFLIIPFINNNINNKSIMDIISNFKSAPLSPILGGLLIYIYIWLKKGE